MIEILVKTLMSEDVSCLSPEAKLLEAAEQMVAQHFSCVVIKQDKFPVGILTERDLVNVLCDKNLHEELSSPVSNFMSSPVISLNQNESLFDALVVNRAQKVRHLPVVNDEDELVGVVTQSDLANAHFQITEIQSQYIEQAVNSKTQNLQQVIEELKALSMEDHLMQIGNRRAMEVDLNYTHSSALRYDQDYSILFFDIDYFKRYNDFYGHRKGDEALKVVAETIKENIRSSDRLYRYGGEELLLLLPNTGIQQSDMIANKLVSQIQTLAIPHKHSPIECLTVSCGCASVFKNVQEKHTTWEEIVQVADQALYQAKNGGRNRVETILPE